MYIRAAGVCVCAQVCVFFFSSTFLFLCYFFFGQFAALSPVGRRRCRRRRRRYDLPLAFNYQTRSWANVSANNSDSAAFDSYGKL